MHAYNITLESVEPLIFCYILNHIMLHNTYVTCIVYTLEYLKSGAMSGRCFALSRIVNINIFYLNNLYTRIKMEYGSKTIHV